jgi:hypothetical protein
MYCPVLGGEKWSSLCRTARRKNAQNLFSSNLSRSFLIPKRESAVWKAFISRHLSTKNLERLVLVWYTIIGTEPWNDGTRKRESKSQVFLGTTGDETVRHRNQGVYRSRCEAGRGSGPEELEPRPASAHNSSTQMRFQSKLFGARESPIQTKDRTPEERMSN